MHLIRINSKLIQNFQNEGDADLSAKKNRVKHEKRFIKHKKKICYIGFECNSSLWKFDEIRKHNQF